MSKESTASELQLDELKRVVLETIRKEGLLSNIEAEIKEVVHKLLTNKESIQKERRENDEQNLLINQLILDYLRYNNYNHTLSVLQSEANIRGNSDSVGTKLGASSSELNNSRAMINTTACRNLVLSATRCDIFKVQDEEDFNNKVKNSKVPVVVDFYADWCGPCKMLTPRLETVIGGHKDKVNLAKVDVDALDAVAAQFDVTSVPTVFGMKNGKVVDKFVGLADEDKIEAFVEKLAMK